MTKIIKKMKEKVNEKLKELGYDGEIDNLDKILKWLREEKKINLYADVSVNHKNWKNIWHYEAKPTTYEQSQFIIQSSPKYNSWKEAVESGIEDLISNNLLKE